MRALCLIGTFLCCAANGLALAIWAGDLSGPDALHLPWQFGAFAVLLSALLGLLIASAMSE